MITPIQIILSIGVLVMLWVAIAKLPKNNLLKLIIFTTILISLFFILQPDVSTDFARVLGVGRGADLILYISTVCMFILMLLIYIRYRKLKEQITQLNREITIIKAKKP